MCSSSPPPLKKALIQKEPVVAIIRKALLIMKGVYQTAWEITGLIRLDISTDLQGVGTNVAREI